MSEQWRASSRFLPVIFTTPEWAAFTAKVTSARPGGVVMVTENEWKMLTKYQPITLRNWH